jgi:two-component system phosphate regulon response regulator PhoB
MKTAAGIDFQESVVPQEQGGRPPVCARQAPPRLLIVDDDPDIIRLLIYTLEHARFVPTAATDGYSAWKIMTDDPPDLVLLDWMLPEMSGIELLRRMRQDDRLREVPVFMLTARAEELDRVKGLECGADDYIVKPFSPRELCARINSRLRVIHCRLSAILNIAGLSLDQQSYRTSVDGSTVMLGPTEFRLLRHFMNNRERVFTRGQIIDNVWGSNVYIDERTVDVHIRRLRKALEPFNKAGLIQTVRSAGYRFSEQA